LLQSLISAHPLIFSFPESHFFPNILSESRINRLLGIASKEARKNAIKFLKMLGRENWFDLIPEKSIRVKSYTRFFVNVLDRIAIESKKKLWLEKTPQHLHYIRPIEKYIKNTKFIHALRNGEDVVASLYEVTHKYPEIWGEPRTIDECTKRWIEDVKITKRYSFRQNHIAIKYEDLVDDTEKILRLICKFIGVEYNQAMLKKYGEKANELLLKKENWKQNVKETIENNNGKKFYHVFDNEERKYVRNILENSASLDFYNNSQKAHS
jgi:hypothetical protein